MPTRLVYLEAPALCESQATVLSITPNFEGGATVTLDETIFYPQGGGQPTDRGRIITKTGTFDVVKVSFVEGEVLHNGRLHTGDIKVGDAASLQVDSELRHLHARLHTGGHLVMTAVDRLVGLPATKGYHFPDGPYVEFEGVIPSDRRESIVAEIQQELDRLVAEDSEVTWRFDTVENLRANGVYIPAEIPAGKPTRVVITSGYQSPCGGTHVDRLGKLKGLMAKGVKVKGGKTRVSYFFA